MNKYFTTLQNERGDVLPNYRAQVVDNTGAIVTIYEDKSGTRFTDSSGNIINYCTAEANGRVSFYFTAEEGQVLQTLDAAGDLVDSEPDFSDNLILDNLPGNIAQSAITDLTTDLAAKAATATLSASTGASGIGFQSRATGSIARTSKSKQDDSVSVLDFIATSKHSAILDGTSTSDVATELQSAIDSLENLHFPGNSGAKYLIDGQLKISAEHQKLRGFGSRLDFRGTDSTKNAVEILSTRRDTATTTPNRTLQEFGGFRILGAASASYASLIFLEEGTTFPYVHDIINEAGTNKGYFGTLADAFMRINGNSTSYVNSPIIERVITHGIVQNGVAGDFPPVGFWIEGAIEGRLYGCEAFYYDECFRLGDSTGTSRNVQNLRFIHCHGEPTKPSDIVNGQDALRIYAAIESRFDSCVFKPGNGTGTGNSRAVRIAAGSDGARNLSFSNCDLQGFGNVNYAFEVESGASAHGIKVIGGTVNDFVQGRVLNSGGQSQIAFDENVTYHNMVPKREKMQARRQSFAGLSVGSGATDNATTTASLTDIFLPEGTPALATPDVSTNFNFLEPYRISTEGTWKVKAYQQTGSTRAIAASNINFRPFRSEEILAQTTFAVDYASLASAAGATSSYIVPGARLGLPVVATFYDGTTSGQNGMILEAYPTGDNEVTVLRFNAHNAAVDLGAGTLVISVIQPLFDLSAAVTYDIAAVAAGSRASTSVSVPGVALGDQCIAWYSATQEGCLIRPRISTAGTVSLEIINPGGAAPTGGASNIIYVGVYKQPSVI